MAIESEEKRQRITDTIERWVENTKVKPYLRDYDIPSLVGSILSEFYHITLCCGHLVKELNEGIPLEQDDQENGTISGDYCKECADEMIREGYARKPKLVETTSG